MMSSPGTDDDWDSGCEPQIESGACNIHHWLESTTDGDHTTRSIHRRRRSMRGPEKVAVVVLVFHILNVPRVRCDSTVLTDCTIRICGMKRATAPLFTTAGAATAAVVTSNSSTS